MPSSWVRLVAACS